MALSTLFAKKIQLPAGEVINPICFSVKVDEQTSASPRACFTALEKRVNAMRNSCRTQEQLNKLAVEECASFMKEFATAITIGPKVKKIRRPRVVKATSGAKK